MRIAAPSAPLGTDPAVLRALRESFAGAAQSFQHVTGFAGSDTAAATGLGQLLAGARALHAVDDRFGSVASGMERAALVALDAWSGYNALRRTPEVDARIRAWESGIVLTQHAAGQAQTGLDLVNALLPK